MAEGDIKLSDSPNVDTAIVEKDGKNLRVLLQEVPAGTLELSDSPNVDTGYIIDENGKKHRVHLVATPEGTLETEGAVNSGKGYIIDSDGKKHRVSLTASLSGGGETINNQDITITQNGTYQAEEGYTGLGTVDVNVSGGGETRFGADVRAFLGEVDANGVLQNASSPKFDLTFTGVLKLSAVTSSMGVLFRRFQNLQTIGKVLFPDLVGGPLAGYNGYGMTNAFYMSSITALLCPKVGSPKQYDFASVCYNCTELTEINFDSLSAINYEGSVFQSAFYGCSSLPTARFPMLRIIEGNSCFSGAFGNCTALISLYFDSLRNANMSSTNAFSNIVQGVTGCTIHFPKNLDPAKGSTTISSLSGYPNFGGTSTVLAFDLPSSLNLTVVLDGNTRSNCYRYPLNDTANSLGWTWSLNTYFYTSTLDDPQVNDTIYSDSACTNAIGTITSIAQ